jgi:ketol-acid reductoisomerase
MEMENAEMKKIIETLESLKLVGEWSDDFYVNSKELYQKWKEGRKSEVETIKETEHYEIYKSSTGVWVELKAKRSTLLYAYLPRV